MRKCFAFVLLVVFSWIGGLTQDARAGVTVDVIFQDWTWSDDTLTIMRPDPGPGCVFQGYYGKAEGRGVSTGLCMDVILTSTDDLVGFGVSVEYDSENGLAVASMREWVGVGVSWNKSGTPIRYCGPLVNGLADASGIISSFDCLITPPSNPPVLAAGTYRIGTIIWDPSGGRGWRLETISAYLNPLYDGAMAIIDGNRVDVSDSVVLGSSVLYILGPEPSTAALLGLGLVGLVLTARGKRHPTH